MREIQEKYQNNVLRNLGETDRYVFRKTDHEQQATDNNRIHFILFYSIHFYLLASQHKQMIQRIL